MIKEHLSNILEAIYKASDAIMEVYNTDFRVELKSDDSPVTIADKKSNAILMEALKKTGVLIVSEEENPHSYEDRKGKTIWLVDPLDGTKDFIRKNDEFCICIALVENGIPIFGIIAAPVQKEIIFGGRDIPSAKINYHTENFLEESYHLAKINEEELNAVIYSRTQITPRIDAFIEQQSEKHGEIERIKKGSALKFFDLVRNSAQVYIRMWPTMEWDIAAGQAIYTALGGEVLNLATFEPLEYNKSDLHNPQFIAKPKQLTLL
ncbi:MAG: inositol monophosphatase family protein [Crocinitomicaceae bacterium]